VQLFGGETGAPIGPMEGRGQFRVMRSARKSPMHSSKPNTTNNSMPFYAIITFDHLTISSFDKVHMEYLN